MEQMTQISLIHEYTCGNLRHLWSNLRSKKEAVQLTSYDLSGWQTLGVY